MLCGNFQWMKFLPLLYVLMIFFFVFCFLFLILLVVMHVMALCLVSFFIVPYACHFSEITLIFSYNLRVDVCYALLS